MEIELVDDPANGDSFVAPLPGSPAYFSYGNMDFFGLFQKHEKLIGIDGNPTYRVVLVDPREILEGTQIILGAYRGSTGGIPNLINAFGYWENQQFGLSGSNEAGMPWNKVMKALNAVINSPTQSDYGGPLSLNNYKYSIDLSQLPMPSMNYRLGGTSISLMDAIATICEDGGCDFFVQLVGLTIKIRTVSRRTQPVLGTIQSVINDGVLTGRVPRASVGVEFRNEPTSSFVVGGPVTTLFQTNGLKSFWGYDLDGKVITSTPGELELKFINDNGNQSVITAFDTEFMDLNAGPVADILGKSRYKCSVFELQCAKGNYETWETYMFHNRRDLAKVANLAGIYAAGSNPVNAAAPVMSDLVDIKESQATLAAEDNANKAMRLYEFVRGYADEYLGRKYLVPLPFILKYQEDETLQVVSSYNIVDSGYLEEGARPLDMSVENEDQFRNPDGRFRCFVKYDEIKDTDLSGIPPQSSVVDNEALYVEASADPQILFEDKPYALVTLPGVLTQQSIECMGDPTAIGALMGTTAEKYNKSASREFMPFAISPDVVAPTDVAIPLQSNIFTYGPWFAAGAKGKVLFEHDSGLTPWDYGDYNTMNQAGSAKVANAITNQQFAETGVLEMTGTPICSLGDVLQSGGPNVTNVDVKVTPQGVTTSYRFQTYTPRFGVFNKGVGERLKRVGLTSQALRKAVRISQRNNQSKSLTNAIVAANTKAFKQNLPNHKKKQTPHGLLVAQNFQDLDEDGNPITRGVLQSATHADAITLSNPGNPEAYKATAIATISSLFRPFTTNVDGSPVMSSLETPQFDEGNIPSVTTLNPFKDGHDIEIVSTGESYGRLNSFRNQVDNTNARLFSFRGPMVITGWGFGIDGKKYPSEDDGANFSDNYMRKQETWKTGPVDTLWDDHRKVWTCHDILRGKTRESLPANGSGIVDVQVGTGSFEMYWLNHFSTAVDENTKVVGGYSAFDGMPLVIAADCASG